MEALGVLAGIFVFIVLPIWVVRGIYHTTKAAGIRNRQAMGRPVRDHTAWVCWCGSRHTVAEARAIDKGKIAEPEPR